MKKLLIAMCALCIGISTMAQAAPEGEWSAMDLGIWFGLPTSIETANVRGFRLGLPISSGKGYVRGLELAMFCAATDNIEGLQLSLVDIAETVSGVQLSLVNVCGEEIKGTQMGLVNCAGKRGWQVGLINSSENAPFQFGLVNMNKNGLWPFSFLVNFGRDTFKSTETIRTESAKCKPQCAKSKK